MKVGSTVAIISGMDSAGGSSWQTLLDGGKNKTISMDLEYTTLETFISIQAFMKIKSFSYRLRKNSQY